MVSWFIGLSHTIFPSGYGFSLRILFVVASTLTAIIWVRILRLKDFSDKSILIFLVLLFLNPLLGLGSILATPDTPLVLFWTLSYYFYIQILRRQRLYDYAALGMSLGLGFCSKYHIVLFVFSGLIFIVWSKLYRQLRPLGVLLTVFLGAAFCSPVIVWNAQNQWSSFLFQINHGFGEKTFEWAWPANYIIAQFLLVNPFIFAALFKSSLDKRERIFSWSQLLFFLSSSFKSVVEANWPITSHMHTTLHSLQIKTLKLRQVFGFWFFFYALIGVYLCTPLSHDAKKKMVSSAQVDALIPELRSYRPLFGASYQVASLLTWRTHESIPKLRELSRHDFYDSLPESLPTEQSFYVLKNDYSDWPPRYRAYKKIRLAYFDNMGLELYQFTYE